MLVPVILFCSAFSSFAGSPETKQPLTIEVPSDWKVEYTPKDGIPFYSLSHESKLGDIAITSSPFPANKEAIPKNLDLMAKRYLTPNGSLSFENPDQKPGAIEGDTLSGSFVVLFFKDSPIIQALFIVGDTQSMWYGEFTGTKEMWGKALDIIKKIKRTP